MRIALVGAEFEENLAVRYLRGALEAAGHEVVQIVYNGIDELERAARELAAADAPLAGLSMVFTHRARQFATLARRVRDLGWRGHLTAGGHFAAFNAELLLRDVSAFDSIVRGEGEGPLVRLAAQLDDPGAVEGLVWRDGAGRIVSNPPAAKPADLDALPRPVHRKPYDRYLGVAIANVLGSRGCTHACAFCSIAAWHALCGGARFRTRSPANVADELAALYRDGVRIFNFHDDNFLLGTREDSFARARELEAELIARGVGRIAFAIKARPDEVDEELFAYLKSIGLFRVFLGVEAGTAEALRRLGRGQTLLDNVRALRIVDRLDIHTCFNLLLYNPDSTLEDVAANVAFLRDHPRNPMNFCRTEIYAGTPLERRLRAQGRLLGDAWGYDYRIRDPRAEQAFQLGFAAFRARNYGEHGLHHTTMRVDYEHQLLAHFFGRDETLRRRVKAFVVDANLDTCGFLEELLERVARGFDGEADERAWVEGLTQRIGEADERFAAGAERILADLRETVAARRSPSHRAWMRKAAAAGLAATLAASPAACKKDTGTSHPSEMIPAPEDVSYTQMCEMAAVPPEPPTPPPDAGTTAPEPDAGTITPGPDAGAVQPAAPDAGATPEAAPDAVPETIDPTALRPAFDALAMSRLADEIVPSDDLQVELWVDAAGHVSYAALHRITLRAERKQALLEFLRTLDFSGSAAPAGRYLFDVTRRQLDEVRELNTQIFEEAPYPTQMHERAPYPTHPSEMVAPPPEFQKKK